MPFAIRSVRNAILDSSTDKLSDIKKAILKTEPYIRPKLSERIRLVNKDTCVRYFNESIGAEEAPAFHVWSDPSASWDDVTLVTFMSVGKFPQLDMMLAQWPGPLSLVIYVDDTTGSELVTELEKRPYLVHKKHVELSIVPGVFVSVIHKHFLNEKKTSGSLLYKVSDLGSSYCPRPQDFGKYNQDLSVRE